MKVLTNFCLLNFWWNASFNFCKLFVFGLFLFWNFSARSRSLDANLKFLFFALALPKFCVNLIRHWPSLTSSAIFVFSKVILWQTPIWWLWWHNFGSYSSHIFSFCPLNTFGRKMYKEMMVWIRTTDLWAVGWSPSNQTIQILIP